MAEPAYARLLADWVTRLYLREAALQTLPPSWDIRVLGLVLAEPEAVVTEARALLRSRRVAMSRRPESWSNEWKPCWCTNCRDCRGRRSERTILDIFNVDLKQTRFYQEIFAEGVAEGREEGQRQERLRIARGLLERVEDDRLLAEKTGLREAEIARLRGERR